MSRIERQRYKEEEAREAERRRFAKLKGEADSWHAARDFILERGLLDEFLLWDAKRAGTSDFAYAALERALNRGDSVRGSLAREASEGGSSLPAHDNHCDQI